MKKLLRKIIYGYVFKRVVAWHKGKLFDQELVDAMYTYDIYCDIKEADK